MPESKTRFDPAGWFVSTCLTFAFGAIALAIAVHLIEAIWPWLLGTAAIVTGIGLFVRLVIWHRGQRW